MKTDNPDNPLVYAGPEPDVDELQRLFQSCSPWNGADWNRVTTNEDVRYCRWDNQAFDFKKHSTETAAAKPFEGASDSRQPLADGIINELVATAMGAFWRAMVRPKAGASEESNYAVKLVEYLMNTVMTQELLREVELAEQYRQTIGWCLIHPSWRREIALENVEVELQALVAMAGQMQEQFPESPLAQLPALILDPSTEDQAAQVLALLYDHYARRQVMDVVDVKLPPLKPARLRQAVRELREDALAILPIPRVVRNEPCVTTLKPWVEACIPTFTTDIQQTTVFRREWPTELQLRQKARMEDWNESWVGEAVKRKGEFSSWPAPGTVSSWPASGAGTSTIWANIPSSEERIEIIWACYRLLDEDNVPGVYYTVFHPAFSKDADGQPSYAAHGLLDYARGRLPYVAGVSENADRQICAARGVPEVAAGWQREVKVHRDALIDLTSIAVNPPRFAYPRSAALGVDFKYGPDVTNIATKGYEPKIMDIPTQGAPLAFKLMERVDQDADNHFGRLTENVAPARQQIKQQMQVNGCLLMWSEVFEQLLALCQQNMADAEFAAATGAPTGWLEQRRSRMGLMAAELHFDVRELDPEYVMSQLKIVNETIKPGDTAGVIDQAKLTRLQLRALNPEIARELVADNQTARQRMFEQVKADVAFMRLGQEANYVENDPAAQTKLQFVMQIVQSNPEYLQALQQGGRFAELLQLYAKNLQFSVTQEENKKVGRLGMQPMALSERGMP